MLLWLLLTTNGRRLRRCKPPGLALSAVRTRSFSGCSRADDRERRSLIFGDLQNTYQDLVKSSDTLIESNDRQGKEVQDLVTSTYEGSRNLVFVIIIAALVISAAIGFFLSMSIIRNVKPSER